MNATDTLTTLLHKRADEKLLAEINRKLPATYAFGGSVKVPQRLIKKLRSNLADGGPDEPGEVYVPTLIEVLKAAAISHLTAEARANEVRDFLAKVDAASDAIEELREGGNQ
jgi:hypothetical protein